MNDTHRCPGCGAELIRGALEGLCPRCLLRDAHVETEELPDASAREYRLLNVVAKSARAIVYLATREDDPRYLALKVFQTQARSAEMTATMDQRRRQLLHVRHPSIVPFVDAGLTGEGEPFMVTHWVRGAPVVEQWRRSPPAADDRLRIATEMCRALECAHGAGVTHGRLKSANVLITRVDHRPSAIVIDFGQSDLDGSALPVAERVAADVGALVDLVRGMVAGPLQGPNPRLERLRADLARLEPEIGSDPSALAKLMALLEADPS